MEWQVYKENNELHINYYPLSLNGVREFIINSDGNVIFPQVVRRAQLSDRDIIGNMLLYGADKIRYILYNHKLEFFETALHMERTCLREVRI